MLLEACNEAQNACGKRRARQMLAEASSRASGEGRLADMGGHAIAPIIERKPICCKCATAEGSPGVLQGTTFLWHK